MFSDYINCLNVSECGTFTSEHKRSSAGQRLREMCLELHLAF